MTSRHMLHLCHHKWSRDMSTWWVPCRLWQVGTPPPVGLCPIKLDDSTEIQPIEFVGCLHAMIVCQRQSVVGLYQVLMVVSVVVVAVVAVAVVGRFHGLQVEALPSAAVLVPVKAGMQNV